MKSFKASITGAMLLVSAASTGWCGEGTPEIRQSGTVSYTSGGISEEERSALEPIAREFNLKLIFALRNGEYLSDTNVVVTSGRGQPVLEAKSEGPWFFAKLPTGQYLVSVTAPNGQTQRKSVVIASKGLRTLDFRWAVVDGEGTGAPLTAVERQRSK